MAPRAKRSISSPVLRKIQEKRQQLEDQILRGVPVDYPAYTSALGARRALLDIEEFTLTILQKEGDIVDVD